MLYAADELHNRRLWDLASQFQNKISLTKLTNKLNWKYGWQSNDEKEDTAQDLFLLTYDVLLKYEKKNNTTITSLLELNEEIVKRLKNEIVMAYRLKVWNNRSDNAVRMSDIYNIDKGSIEDVGIKYILSEEYEITDNTKEDVINQDIKEKREQIILALTNILQEDMRNIIHKYLFGDDKYGMLTHNEIALQNNRCRSAITRRIKRGIKKLSDFTIKHNIKLNQILYPTNQDMKYILSCTSKEACAVKSNKKSANIIHISSIKKKNTLLPNYVVKLHNIEEYLYA